MITLKLIECQICKKEFGSTQGLAQHTSKSHNIKFIDYILKYEFNNIPPKCKCGCNLPVAIRGSKIMEYVNGHCDTGHYKIGVTPKRDEVKWKESLKISAKKYNDAAKKENPKYRSGSNGNFYGRTHTEDAKAKIKEKVEIQIKTGKHPFIGNINGRVGKSSLEVKFEKYLIDIGVNHEHNYKIPFVPEGKNSTRYKYYDFYLPEYNLLVEIHGSWWHPESGTNLNKMQINNLENDAFKKQLAKDRNYDLLVIYDYELDKFINENLLSTRADIDPLKVEIIHD